jgi:hypothetical protein
VLLLILILILLVLELLLLLPLVLALAAELLVATDRTIHWVRSELYFPALHV